MKTTAQLPQGVYAKLHLHIIIAVKLEKTKLSDSVVRELSSYINKYINDRGHNALITNGTKDHIHIFLSLNPKKAAHSLVRSIKAVSSKWLNAQGFFSCRFHWQEGYGAFSYSMSHVVRILKFVENQQHYHKNKCFREEYIECLRAFGINYDEKFIFKLPK